jgi:hypothetical protein
MQKLALFNLGNSANKICTLIRKTRLENFFAFNQNNPLFFRPLVSVYGVDSNNSTIGGKFSSGEANDSDSFGQGGKYSNLDSAKTKREKYLEAKNTIYERSTNEKNNRKFQYQKQLFWSRKERQVLTGKEKKATKDESDEFGTIANELDDM